MTEIQNSEHTSMSWKSIVPMSQRLIVALDTSTRQDAEAIIQKLSPLNVTFKVGMGLFYQEGMPWVQELERQGHSIFLDLKLHDIPQTVASATQSLVSQGVSFLTLHTQGGPHMMRQAVLAANQASKGQKPKIIGVTLLTSLSQDDLSHFLQVPMTPKDYTVGLAKHAQQAGLSGIVCSPHEVSAIREACGPSFILITPGIRLQEDARHDQSRVMTPGEAIKNGSDFLVVGRSILQANEPYTVASQILEAMDQ